MRVLLHVLYARARAVHEQLDARIVREAPDFNLFALLAGNLLAIVCVLASLPFPRTSVDLAGEQVMYVGTLTLIAMGLAFAAYAVRRGGTLWWAVAMALNVVQIGRLVPAIVAIAIWAGQSAVEGLFWALVFVPFLGVLSVIGVLTTRRELRKSRRRRLVRAA